MTPDTTVVWRRRDDVLWRRSIDAVVLLPVGTSEPVSLPGTGAMVWDLLAEPATLDELVTALAEVYEGDAATIARDVVDLLVRLESLAAIEAAP